MEIGGYVSSRTYIKDVMIALLHSRKRLLITGLLAVIALTGFAQRPDLKLVEPRIGSMGQSIILKGTGFGTDATKIQVNFGSVKADILTIEEQRIEVKLPAGATYRNISVTNKTAGRTGYSRLPFLLSFNGTGGFGPGSFSDQLNFTAAAATADGMFDLCMCDFDGDKRNDVAASNDNLGYLSIYPNNSSGPGVISFGNKIAINMLARTQYIRCGDLNGDGRPDIVIGDGGTNNKLYILKNNSTGPGSFVFAQQSFSFTDRKPRQFEIADMDLDGRPELVVTSSNAQGVAILNNQSTASIIVFAATPIILPIAGTNSTDGIAVNDLNGDLFPEIVTAQYQVSSNVYVFANKSLSGTFSFSLLNPISLNYSIKNMKIADVDGDIKPDILLTQQTPSGALVMVKNTTPLLSSGGIEFGDIKYWATEGVPWGLDLGDLDGDGLVDIAVSSHTSKTLSLFNNKTLSATAEFTRFARTGLNYLTRHVVIGDLDNDGKPDIAMASIDDGATPGSKLSVLRNKICVVPELLPKGPVTICNTLPFQLSATLSGGASYDWTNTTTNTTLSGTNTYIPTVGGEWKVTLVSENGSCSETSNVVKLEIVPGSAADPLPVTGGPVCFGSDLNLSLANDLGAGYTYVWNGPNNFNASGATVSRTNMRIVDAGEYFVDVYTASGCLARRSSVMVQVVDIPDFKINYLGSDILCQGDLKTLNLAPYITTGYTYQWFKRGTGALGVTTATYTVGASGEYYVVAKPTAASCADIEVAGVKIVVASLPVPDFTAPATACNGTTTDLVNTSVSDPSTDTFYSWLFPDGTTSIDKNPSYSFKVSGPQNIKLSVSYRDNACTKSVTKSVTVSNNPVVDISPTGSNTPNICPGGSVTLNAVTTGPVTGYKWSTNATTNSITVTSAGVYSVEVSSSDGCKSDAKVNVEVFPTTILEISATPDIIKEGESSQLVANGLTTYLWEPAGSLSNAEIANPVATPVEATTYTVVGLDANGCQVRGAVTVKLKGDAIVDQLTPENFFSPNGDNVGEVWSIERILEFTQCSVTIYDERGVKVFDAKPYNNDWDGTYKGKLLPQGVYYYVIRCDGEPKPRMGSITLLR